jgi:hypothetical protein
MSQPPPPAPLPLLHPPNTARSALDMTETQKAPVFSAPFHPYPHRRLPQPTSLPPLEIPLDPAVQQPRSDYTFRSPVNQLPSIHAGPPPPRQQQQHHQPPSLRGSAPVDKLLHPIAYTPPRSDNPYSPQQYGPSISPRSEFDSRGPRRLMEQRYPYEDSRPVHPSHHEQSYASLTSPVEQHPKSYAPLPSPSYTSSYASSSTPFRGSVGSHSHSHRGSLAASLGPLTNIDPPTAGPPPQQEPRAYPLPGSIRQPVVHDKL